jgi:hypothetical protein
MTVEMMRVMTFVKMMTRYFVMENDVMQKIVQKEQ